MAVFRDDIHEWLYANRRYAISFLAVFYSVGIAGTLLPSTFGLFLKLFPLALLLSFIMLMVFSDKSTSLFSYGLILLIAVAGFVVEVAGVSTGKIFGNYWYGETLGLKLFNTPLLIGINWAMLVTATASVTDRLKLHPAMKVIIASSLMVLYDLLMEQVTGNLDMWHWENDRIPVLNYIAWFAVASMMHAGLRASKAGTGFYLALPVLICQSAFFIFLNIYFMVAG